MKQHTVRWFMLATLFLLPLPANAEFTRLLENPFGAAYRYTIPPQQTVELTAGQGGLILVALNEGVWTLETRVTGLLPGSFAFLEPGQIQLTNSGSASLELLAASIRSITHIAAGNATLAQVPLHQFLYENDRVEIYRVSIPPGSETGMHHHSRKGMGLVVNGGELMVTLPDGKHQKTTAIPGTAFWHEEDITHHLLNTGDRTVLLLDVEWK